MKYLLTISTILILSFSNCIFSQNNSYGIPTNNNEEDDFKLKLNFDLGYGNWQKTIPNGTQDFIVEYYHNLEDGFDIEASILFYFKNNFGIGITGSRFDAYSKLNNVLLIDDSTNTVISQGYLEDDIRILFLGTTFSYFFETRNKRNIIQIDMTPGYFFYNNSRKWIIYDDQITGNSTGINIGVNYDFKLSKFLGIGLGYNILIGSLKEVEINNEFQELEQNESLTRTNITLGFNIYL